MKSWKYLALAAILSVTPVAAQHAPKSQVQRLVDQLNLTPDQKAKADPFLEEDGKKIRALRDDSSLSAEDRKKKSAEIRKGTVAKLKPILTEDQWKQFEQLREERQKQSKKK
jgi:periplasmic protein CpxP/Spy